jgi:NhaP-type Na+/H+ or K+/H+ antiporter
MSATDPVAVVSILKSAGASPKLTTLIIGESLMNDGTAMIFFSLFFGMVEGHNYSAGQIAAYMFQMTLGIILLFDHIELFYMLLLVVKATNYCIDCFQVLLWWALLLA